MLKSLKNLKFVFIIQKAKRLIFLLLLVISGINNNISAQQSGKIFGVVKDAVTLIPLENVNIIVVENSLGCRTDQKGAFIISGVAEGNFAIQASMTGYKTDRKKITIKPDKSLEVNFYLNSQIYQIDSVNITAPKEYRSLLKEPYTEPFSLFAAITTVTNTAIIKQGAHNIIDAMNYVPGGLTETRGRQVKQFFSVRGQKYPYPDYAINGIWQQEFEELPYFFSTSDIEKIEIIRSSAALLTGLSGTEGLIDIKTREYSGAESNLEMEYGSFNSIHTHLSNGNKIGRFSYAAGIGYDKSDGPEGKHAKEAMASFNSQVHYQITDKLSLKANLFYLDGKRQLALAEQPADKKYLDMIQNFDPYKSILSNLKIVYRPRRNLSSELQLFYSYRDPKFNDEVTGISTREKDIEYGLNFMQSVSITDNNILRFGGLYDHWVAPNGKRFYTGKRCDTETFSGVLVDEQQFGGFTLDAGLRWTRTFLKDYAAFNIQGEGGQFKNVTPIHDLWEPSVMQVSLGGSYHIDQALSINLNLSASQVKPLPGSLDVNLNVPQNEGRLKFDLGAVRQLGNSGKLALTTFWVIQKNAIVLSGDTFTDTTAGRIRELYLNRDQNQKGIELEIVSPQLFSIVAPFVNFSLMNSLLKSGDKMITNRENPVAISGGGLYLAKRGIDLNIFGKFVSGFENIRFASKAAGPQPLGNFFTIDLTGGYTTHGRVPVNFYFRVRNLTDKRYSTVVGYPDFGRSVYFGMKINLAKERMNK
jgi:outer membrane receptor protein involved in Fe transport